MMRRRKVRAVIGNCGFGIVPSPPHLRDLIMRNLAVDEGMDLDALRAGIDWRFQSFAEYMVMLRGRGAYMNLGVLVGHSAMRTAVMGDDASVRKQPTAAELAEMKRLIAEAMDQARSASALRKRVDRQKPREQEDHNADHRSEDGDIVEQESNRSPQYRIAHPAERHDRAGCHPHSQVHESDRKEVRRYVALDLLCDVYRLPLVFEAGRISTRRLRKASPLTSRKNSTSTVSRSPLANLRVPLSNRSESAEPCTVTGTAFGSPLASRPGRAPRISGKRQSAGSKS
jgi:hypothetical protein